MPPLLPKISTIDIFLGVPCKNRTPALQGLDTRKLVDQNRRDSTRHGDVRLLADFQRPENEEGAKV